MLYGSFKDQIKLFIVGYNQISRKEEQKNKLDSPAGIWKYAKIAAEKEEPYSINWPSPSHTLTPFHLDPFPHAEDINWLLCVHLHVI
jgi:hypothetical protein